MIGDSQGGLTLRNLQFNGSFSGTLDLANLSIPAAGTDRGRLTLELGSSQGVWDFIRMLQTAFPSAHTSSEHTDTEPPAIGLVPEPPAKIDTTPPPPISVAVATEPPSQPEPAPRRRGRKPGPRPGTPRPVGRGRKGANAT